MKTYLRELHKKPDHHKKRFAFLISSIVTLSIFAVWSLVMFETEGGVLASDTSGVNSALVQEREVSPFQAFRLNMASGLDGLRRSFESLKSGFNTVDIESEYEEMKSGALNIYGR
jgi:hypothetical protein